MIFQILTLLIFLFLPIHSFAITLDWSGQFRADNNFIHNYQMNRSAPAYSSDNNNSGESVPGEGQKTATFNTFFMRLKPTALVNDNIIIHSEWNVGDPEYGFMGRNVFVSDSKDPFTTRKDAMSIQAARLWLDAHTDFGTLQVGRAPMHWGLGVIFNAGNDIWDRYQSTSDTIRLVSKFGYLSVMPLYSKVAVGKNIAGARVYNSVTGTDIVTSGSDDVTDYGIGLKFDNPDEELEAGFLFYKRNAQDVQSTFYFPDTASSYTAGRNALNLKLFDFYAKKKWRHLEFRGELPLYTGNIGDLNQAGKRNVYKSVGFAGEVEANFDVWSHSLKFGIAPGQEATETNNHTDTFGAMYFNRNYKLGNILFRYNLHNFGENNPDTVAAASLHSPYDVSIVNAKYLALKTGTRSEHWSWYTGLVYAQAAEVAQAGKDFFNHRTRIWGTAAVSQDKSLGWEWDLGGNYIWDENVKFGTDFGMFFPGGFYGFNNQPGATNYDTNMVTEIAFNVGIGF